MIEPFATFILSAVLCGIYLYFARRWRILDQPNSRSSHQKPTPHGGGLPLLVAFFIAVGLSAPWQTDYVWLTAMTCFLMLLGVIDDFRGLSVRSRFLIYALVALSTAAILMRGSADTLTLIGILQMLVFAFGIMWGLNLYNFMDGIDGIAATQCVLVCVAVVLLVQVGPLSEPLVFFCSLLAASQLGFLIWNWAPARLFMGDAGSIPTGFLLGSLAGYSSINGVLTIACWLVLLSIFITDASWTLVWRMFTGQAFTQAHKLHAYQRLSRHWASHSSVVGLLLALNIFWSIPIAWATLQWPEYAIYLVILAYIPLFGGMAKVAKLP